MSNKLIIPTEDDNINCHLQQLGMGSLICRAAKQTGERTTNEVNPIICYNCDAGKIFREVACDAVSPKIMIYNSLGGSHYRIDNLLCKLRRRETSIQYCRTCGLVVAETTREIVSNTRGLFEAYDFYSSYKDIEKARECIRDGNFENAVTRSISCLESTMQTCHDKLGFQLPDKKQVTDLWKSTRKILNFEELDPSGSTTKLMNSLFGVVSNLGAMRNTLGDAHGKGILQCDISEIVAEIAINTASILSTTILRRFNQIMEHKE